MVRTDAGTLIAARSAVTTQTVVTSTDGGLTWTPRAFKAGTYILTSDLHHHNGTTYATISRGDGGIWKSTDEGATWSRLGLAEHLLESVTFTDGKIIVSAPGNKPNVWISPVGGATFELLTNTGLDGIDPGKLIGHQNYIFLQDRSRLLRLRIGTPTGEPVAIVTQPEDSIASSSAGATLTVAVTGTGPVTYQWFRGLGGIGTPVGTDSPTYVSDPAVAEDTYYYVEISNGFGPPTRSHDVLVSFLYPPRMSFDFRNKAYFESTTPSFGPAFSRPRRVTPSINGIAAKRATPPAR